MSVILGVALTLGCGWILGYSYAHLTRPARPYLRPGVKVPFHSRTMVITGVDVTHHPDGTSQIEAQLADPKTYTEALTLPFEPPTEDQSTDPYQWPPLPEQRKPE